MEKSSIASLVLILLVMTILNDTEASRRGLLDYQLDVYKKCEGFQGDMCMYSIFSVFNSWRCSNCIYHKPADSPANSPAIYHTMGNNVKL